MEHKLESRPVPIPSRASPDRSRGKEEGSRVENPLPPVIIERKAQSHEAGLELYRIDDTVKKQYSSPQRRSLAKDELRNCSKYATIYLGLSGIIRGKWRERLGKRDIVVGRNLGPIKWPTHAPLAIHVSRRQSYSIELPLRERSSTRAEN